MKITVETVVRFAGTYTKVEPQRAGWQAILDNFKRHVEEGR